MHFAVRHPGDAATAENGLYDRKKEYVKSIRWLVGCFLLEDLLNLKGRRVEYLYRYPTYEKENYKNNVGCIIFMMLVYLINVMESCVTCEKIMNECRMFYE